MDHRARSGLVERGARRYDPIRKAISAKARQPHQVDILRIVAMAQVAHKAAEGGGGMGIVQSVERIV